MKLWEYVVLVVIDGQVYTQNDEQISASWKSLGLAGYLNQLGAEGWELVDRRQKDDVEWFYFKRPKPSK
ncbi:MAG TPA: hypothetical protein VJU84_07660 [Pyrinomonadaceae bacterium]|nr:hypothetical protein [Pyrinomonadaceae bacterium]